jgi:Uma2 family endonuclease
MNAAALKRMKVPEFVNWAERQPSGRYELEQGFPVAMAPQRAEHAETNGLAFPAPGLQSCARASLAMQCPTA